MLTEIPPHLVDLRSQLAADRFGSALPGLRLCEGIAPIDLDLAILKIVIITVMFMFLLEGHGVTCDDTARHLIDRLS